MPSESKEKFNQSSALANEGNTDEDQIRSKGQLVLPPLNMKLAKDTSTLVNSVPQMTPRNELAAQPTSDGQDPSMKETLNKDSFLDPKRSEGMIHDYQAVLGASKTANISPVRPLRQLSHANDYGSASTFRGSGVNSVGGHR